MATVTKSISAQVNGLTNSFFIPDAIVPGSLTVHLNGIRLDVDEYSEVGVSNFTMSQTPRVGDRLEIQYEIVSVSDSVLFPIVVGHGIDPTI